MIITTVKEAIKALEDASILSGRLEAAHAEYEALITPFKQEYERATQADAEQLSSLKAAINAFIESNGANFQKPRKIKTQWGEFGLQTSKELRITNPQQVITFAKRNNYTDLFKEKITIVKKAVESIIKNGVSVPGATISCKERPLVKIVPTLPNMAE